MINDRPIKQKLWSRNFVLAMLVSASVSLANGMFSPALPIYAQTFGITTDIVGSILSLSLFLSMFGRFTVGGLSTHHSKKKLVAVSLCTILFAYICFFFATNVYLIAAAKILQAVGAGMNLTVLSTLAIDNLPESRMGEGIGIFSLSGSLAQVVAPMLGTFLAKNHQFVFLFASSAVSTAAAILTLIWIRDKPREHASAAAPEGARGGRPRFHIRDFIYPPAFLPAVMLLFNGIIFSAITNFLAIYGLSKGIENVGLFFTVNSVVMLISRPFMGKLTDRKPPAFIIVPAILLATLACVVIANAETLPAFALAAVLYGLGFGSCQSAIQVMAVRNAPPEARGIANSTFYVGGDIGLAMGSALAGVLAYRVGYGNMYTTMAVVSFVSLVVFLVYSRALRRAQDRKSSQEAPCAEVADK